MARNVITDVEGVLVRSADDEQLASGVTVVLFEDPRRVDAITRRAGLARRGTAEPEMTERVDGSFCRGRLSASMRRAAL